MTNFLDRIQASAERALQLTKDKEARAVLALNDAAVNSREGKFFYLPESKDPGGNRPAGPVTMPSTIPRLLYTNHLWTDQETKAYWQCSDADRYIFIQGTTPLKAYLVFLMSHKAKPKYRTNGADVSNKCRANQPRHPSSRHVVSILADQVPRKHLHLWTRIMVQAILDGRMDRKGIQRH